MIDAAGAEVYPGWINARTNIGLSEPGASGYQDTTEMLDYNPQLRTVVAYHNDSESIPVARANGITTVAVFPNGGVLGGQVPVMNLDGWTWEESAVDPLAGISFQFPGIGGGGRGGGVPGTERAYDDLERERDARLEALLRLLDRARAYAKARGADRVTDWVLEALVPVRASKSPTHRGAVRLRSRDCQARSRMQSELDDRRTRTHRHPSRISLADARQVDERGEELFGAPFQLAQDAGLVAGGEGDQNAVGGQQLAQEHSGSASRITWRS